jgi:transposase InsO family protein/transposase-like protein
MVQDHAAEHGSQWAAIGSIAEKLGCNAETLRRWVRQAERDSGLRAGLTTDERHRLKELERENRSSSARTRFCARRRRFSPRRSSTAERDDGGVCGRAPRHVRGRADLRDAADRPGHLDTHRAQALDPTRRSARRQRDEQVQREVRRVWDANVQVYGPRKVWKHLRREGSPVARCTVERLMRALGLRGAVRGRAFRITTTPAALAARPSDLVARNFTATQPNQLWVADLTYVATWRGFVYVAFVIDAFARHIVGWRVSVSLRTDLALDALEQALYDRAGDLEGLVHHHSDRGTQCLSIRYTERLAEPGIAPSVGSRGDSYDNAHAESVIGLFKTEVMWRRGPWRTVEDVEFATLEWVAWFDTQRLLEPIAYVPPAEYEAGYYHAMTSHEAVVLT